MSRIDARRPSLPALPLALALAAPAAADGVTVVLHGSHVERVSAGSTTLEAHELAPGRSVGQVEFVPSGGHAIGAADGRDLGTYFGRNKGVQPDWHVELKDWQDSNGPGYDFFLFEVGGNDSVRVAPRLANGSYGKEVVLGGWTPTGYQPESGPNAGQAVYGLAFKTSQLLDGAGQPLPDGAALEGLRLRSDTIDGAAFLVHRPDPTAGVDGDGSVTVSGALRAGQLVELTYQGPWASETGLAPNPFLDRKLTVTLVAPDGRQLTVPGFFDADGVGGDAGAVWRARFRPDAEGSWTARARFREGPGVAVDPDPAAGSPGLLEGVKVTFAVGPRDRTAPGFLRWGTLRDVGAHHPRFDSGPYFVKAGANSPENLLAYRGFDGVAKRQGGLGVLHAYEAHRGDWRPGDPLFASRDHGVDSKGLIGALNYLSQQGLNSVHAMLMNLGGDGDDAHPFLSIDSDDFAKTHYDTSRLAQWHAAFEHAATVGIALHLTMAETEVANELWLDGGQLGVQRKLFYREMVARFAHLPAVLWDLCEENDYPVDDLRDFADWVRALDPYGHPVTFHNKPDDFTDYDQVVGEPRFSATALQFGPDQVSDQVEKMRADSAAAGNPWAVGAVEHTPYLPGVTDTNHDELRKRVLYDVLFSGGHLEWYAGWHDLPLGGDLSLEDFRTREEMWRFTRQARELLESLPFWEMQPADGLLSGEPGVYGGGEVLAKPGECYALYMPQATAGAVLDLSAATGGFELRWYDPRQGQFAGAAVPLQGGAAVGLGAPPYAPNEDWAAVVARPDALSADVDAISVAAGGVQTLTFDAGAAAAGRPYVMLGSTSGTTPGFFLGQTHVPLNYDRYTRWTIDAANGPVLRHSRGVVPPSGIVRIKIVLQPGAFAAMVGSTLHHAVVLEQPTDYATNPVALRILP